ncbi:hypothetical protein D3C85_527520 [compost metagenome]
MMLSNFRNALMLALILIAALAGYTSYTLYGDLEVARTTITSLTNDIEDRDRTIALASESCRIDETIVRNVLVESEAMAGSISTIIDELNTINSTEDKTNATTPTPAKVPVPSTDSDAALMRLLDNAYCTAAPSDSYCTTR